MLKRKQIELTDEAIAIISRHASKKGQGAWVSEIIVKYAALLIPAESAIDGGIQERNERLLQRIDQRTAMLVKEREGQR